MLVEERHGLVPVVSVCRDDGVCYAQYVASSAVQAALTPSTHGEVTHCGALQGAQKFQHFCTTVHSISNAPAPHLSAVHNHVHRT